MPTPVTSVVLFLIASLAGAVGQFLYKSGADRATAGWTSYIVNGRILGGVICYVAVMVLFVAAFKRGGALSVLYPIYATTFIWAALIAHFAYGTPIRPVNMGGMLLLIVGMYMMGRS
jgi:multidrug transporter EmrE-like cation transporter